MRDLLPEDWKVRIKRFLLSLDAWIDFTLFRSASGARESYERFSTFMDRFHVSGWRRLLNELLSEGTTLGTVGLVALLALAMPAFRETSDDDWLKKSERTEVSLTAADSSENGQARFASTSRDAAAIAEQTDDIRRLMAEVEKLPQPLREVLMLYYYEDCTYQDLAARLNVSAATINARLTQARMALRQKLNPQPESTTMNRVHP